RCTSSSTAMPAIPPTGGSRTAPAPRACSAAPASRSSTTPRRRCSSAASRAASGDAMIEAAMIWNEPNNKSHWDFEIDPDWSRFAEMAKRAAQAIAAERARLPKVLGGISPIDQGFMRNMDGRGVLAAVDAVAVHGFPLDWNHWQIDEWPAKLDEIRAVTSRPLWVSEVGV